MPDAFGEGYQQGISAVETGRRQALLEKEERERELDRVIERRRQTLITEDLELDKKIKQDEAARYVEAEKAWRNFEEAEKSINWDDPQAPRQYEMISGSYLHSIL